MMMDLTTISWIWQEKDKEQQQNLGKLDFVRIKNYSALKDTIN